MTATAQDWPRVLHRVPWVRASSCALAEVEAEMADGSMVRLVAKDSSSDRMLPQARHARPSFLFDPTREATMYGDVLDPWRHGTARCHATLPPAEAPELLLERVDGSPLEEVAYGRPWHAATRWLAAFHAGFAEGTPGGATVAGAAWLVGYDRGFFERWPDRAVRALRDAGRSGAQDIAALARRYDAVLDVLDGQPRSLVHGDFHPANIVVSGHGRICVLDWELAGWGPSLLDLAALTSGRWPPSRRAALERAYRTGGPDRWPDDDEFSVALECCRLHLALQWLGWATDWAPEPRRATDWVAAATRCAERLGM